MRTASEQPDYTYAHYEYVATSILSKRQNTPTLSLHHQQGRDGEGLFRLACENDLEGIVGKRKSDPYLPGHASWLKIRNHAYSPWVGREELFERERGGDPHFQVWDGCALVCEEAISS